MRQNFQCFSIVTLCIRIITFFKRWLCSKKAYKDVPHIQFVNSAKSVRTSEMKNLKEIQEESQDVRATLSENTQNSCML